MNEPTIDAEVVNQNQALAVREPQTVSLFRTDEPDAIILRASAVASLLRDVIAKQGLISNIKGKQYPKCEAWTLCGTMLGVFPVLCWSRPVPDGWEARVEAKTRDGAIVGAAEAQCLRTERNWSDRDDFALRSMSQTRATAKALRMPLGFIMTLAGYEACPSEEMPHDERPQQQPTRSQAPPAKQSPPPTQRTIPKRDAPIASEKTRQWMLEKLAGLEEQAWNFFVSKGMLTDGETLDKLPLEFVPTSSAALLELKKILEDMAAAGTSPSDEPPGVTEPEAIPEPSEDDWRNFPLPFTGRAGKPDAVPKGTPLEKLDKKYLFGLVMNVKVETEYNGKPLSPEKLAADRAFRASLDKAGRHYGFLK